MKLIFWNTKKHTDFSTMLEILSQERPDILFLAETAESLIVSNSTLLNTNGYEYFENPGCDRILIVKQTDLKLSLGKQSTYYSAIVNHTENVKVISVHLPSQMYQSMDSLKSHFRDFRSEIDIEFGSALTENIIVIGDFNVNPFEKPMIDFDGFAASNSIKLKKEAVNLKVRKALYYNPTWTLYQNNNFPGTKYFKRPSTSSFDVLEHHFLDQVVLSYHMSQRITFEKIGLIHKTSNYIIFDVAKNSIQLSDHLPLIYEYKIS